MGGGLLIYLKDDIYPHSDIIAQDSYMLPDIECLAISLNVPGRKRTVIIDVYRPPNTNIERFLELFDATLGHYDDTGVELWVVGDMNINLHNLAGDKAETLINIGKARGLVQLIDEVTRPKEDNPSCLDLIFTNASFVVLSGVMGHLISDHLPVVAVKKKPRIKYLYKTFCGRSYRRYDRDDFYETLVYHNWESFYLMKDPDLLWAEMSNLIIIYLDANCPVKTLTIREYENAWATNEIRELIADRASLIRDYLHTMDPQYWEEAKVLRGTIGTMVKEAKASHVRRTLEEANGSSSKFWKEINNIINPSAGTPAVSFKHHDTGEKLEGVEASSYFNEYFSTVGDKLFTNLATNGKARPQGEILDKGLLLGSLNLDDNPPDITLEEDDILKLVEGICVGKSSGIPGLSSKVLKDAFLLLYPQLTHIYNCSLQAGRFPEAWGCASVIPIPKQGDLSSISNWRPISLLPLPGKLLEKIVHKIIMSHLEANHVLTNAQFGFRPGRGTSDAVFSLSKVLYEARDRSETCGACYIDFSKAFDSIHHSKLISEFHKISPGDWLTKWVASYLSNRKQATFLNGETSPTANINYGVPQGSILGPLLFIIFANSVTRVVKKCYVSMYADDMVLVGKGTSIVAASNLQEDVTSVCQWCNDMGLSLNAKKTQVVWYGSESKINEGKRHTIKANGVPLKTVDSYCYLGVTIDGLLSFREHMKDTLRNVGFKLYRFGKIRSILDQDTSVLIYKQTILPHSEYCPYIIDSAKHGYDKKLQRLQNKGLRIALLVGMDPRNRHVRDLHTDCGVEYLSPRRELNLASVMYNHSRLLNVVPTANPRTRGDRQVKFRQIRPNGQKYKLSPFYRGCQLWNILDVATQLAPTPKSFKSLVKVDLASKKARGLYPPPVL